MTPNPNPSQTSPTRPFGLTLKGMGLLLGALLAALLALGCTVVLWASSEGSLSSLVQLAQRHLPSDQSLETQDVSGSVRDGGRIGWVRWRQGQLTVQAHDVRLAWQWQPLLHRHWQWHTLSMASLSIDDQRPPTPEPASPPADLGLPLTLDLPFAVAKLTWTGAMPIEATEVSGHYAFNSKEHSVRLGKGHISSGTYQFSGQLQAQTPMALQVQLSGQVLTQLPGASSPLTVLAQAQLGGQLAGADASLALQAQLEPHTQPLQPTPQATSTTTRGKGTRTTPTTKSTTSVPKQPAMRAQVQAQVKPWQAQPLVNAHAQWQGLDLSALLTQAPRTLLTGKATVTPQGVGWQGALELTNTVPGPWDQHLLPLDALRAQATFASGQWLLQSLKASRAGGTLTGSGQFQSGRWQGRAAMAQLDPATLDTRLAKSLISGQLQASQTDQGMAFTAQAQASGPKALTGLSLDKLTAQGLWAAPVLRLNTLHLTLADATVDGQLSLDTRTWATGGQLALALPGAQGSVYGQLSAQTGQGTVSLQVSHAAQTTQWLSRLPGMAKTLGGQSATGSMAFTGQWQGGWAPQGQAAPLSISAKLHVPSATWTPPPSTLAALGVAKASPALPWQAKDLQAEVSGTLAALRLSSRGQASQGTRQFDWQLQANAAQTGPGQWLAQLRQVKLSGQLDATAGRWTLTPQTTTPLALTWAQTANTQTLTLAAGSAQLQGPVAGEMQLSWDAGQWSQRPHPSQPGASQTQWHTRGRVNQLPLVWLEAFGTQPMAELGIRSDLLFAGQWDASQTDTLRAKASLVRSTGDLHMRPDDKSQVLPAGVREASLGIELQGPALAASLRWASARAGVAQANLQTQLTDTAHGWVLADDAPLSGDIKAEMPPMEAWSVLAPPGWRLHGTLDTDMTLSGTLNQPRWLGRLHAQNFAVRSVAHGIDFRQGTLAASLSGQRLGIDALTVRGATGADGSPGGLLTITGSAQWQPNPDLVAPGSSPVTIELQALVQSLRLSSRSDHRVTVSGELDAQLKGQKLTIQGKLTADQALITLPNENTPTLGSDVVVRKSAAKTPARAPAKAPTSAPGRSIVLTPDVHVTLDLGPSFHVRGRGVDTRLAGELTLLAKSVSQPQLSGTLRTVKGTYQAYGQRLDIEQGELRFTGAYDNPALDILAIRPKLSQRVGVQVNGTALSPVVRLYAEPDLPEAEKLSWLVLGRSPNGSGGEAALLQQAAMALLGGSGQGPTASLVQALGLDELSFRNASNDTTSGATLTVGKRLSNDFYVAYESGLAGSAGVFSIFYDLSQRLTLRAQTGVQSTIDLIWTHRYD